MNYIILSDISRLAVICAVILFDFLFYKNIYGCKYEKKRYYVISYLIAVLLLLLVNRIGDPYINMLYSFISENVICILLFESRIKKIWFHNLLFWFLLTFSDTFTVLIWVIINESTVNFILSDKKLMLAGNILFIIFSYGVYRIYITFMQDIKYQGIRIKTALFMIIMIFFELWIVTDYGNEATDRSGGVKMLIMLTGFLVINLFFTYVIDRISEAYRYRYELSLAERLNEIHLSGYTEISYKYEESRAIIHDIKKHLMAINELDDAERSRYLSDVYERMDRLFGGFKCSNKILSVVVSQKMSYARSKGIEVIISAEDVPIDFVDDFDITAIFANLWDNAIEACDKVTDRKYIEMSMTRVNDFILINIENSYNGVIKTKNKKLVSTKSGHSSVGLKSVRLSVEKYDGVFMTNYNSRVFRAEITLPIS